MIEERKTPNASNSMIEDFDFSGDISDAQFRKESLNNFLSSYLTKDLNQNNRINTEPDFSKQQRGKGR